MFTNQLEKSRESTDAANIRSAYAEVMAKALEESKNAVSATVTKTQTVDGWQNSGIETIAGVAIGTIDDGGAGTVSISYDPDTGDVTIGNATSTPSFLD